MKSMAVRGTIILLAAVALIGALVALRVAQAQSTPTYTISVTPDKVLEHRSGSVEITVTVEVDEAFMAEKTVYLLIANESIGDFRCNYISSCVTPAKNADASSGGDFRVTSIDTSVIFQAGNTTNNSNTIILEPHQDFIIEGDEKIYLALCSTATCTEGNDDRSTLLRTASITIVGERVWADNTTRNTNTSTVALNDNQPVAASFTTGSDSNGYRMNNVKLKFGINASEDNATNTPTDVSVKLFRDATLTPGVPGALISNLVKLPNSEDPAAGKETIYTKSEGGIPLEPSSTYWVQVSGTKGFLETTGDRGQNGWAIQDGLLVDNDPSADAINWMSNASRSLKMQVSGIPRGAVVVEPATLSVEENRTATYSVRLDSPPLTNTRVNVTSEDRSIATAVDVSDSDASTTTLTFSSGNTNDTKSWWKPQTVTVKGGFVSGEPKIKITHAAGEENIKKSGLPSVNLTVRKTVIFEPVLGNLDAENADTSHDLFATSTIAQPFRAGDREYSLTHVQVEFEGDTTVALEEFGNGDNTDVIKTDVIKVCSRKGSGQNIEPDLEDCSVYKYDGTPFDGIHTYELEGGKEIRARTDYYVVIKGDNTGKVRLTDDTTEAASHGWSLGNNHVTKNMNDMEWMTIPNSVVKVKLIGRTGDEIPTPTPSPTPTETPTVMPTPTETPTGTATAQAALTATAQANDMTATAVAATATAQANLTATAVAADPTAQANLTATAQATATAVAATATAQANATATARAMPTPTATAVAGPGVVPSGLGVARTGSTAILTWTPGSDATGHAVLAVAEGDTKSALDLPRDARSYTFTGLERKVYTYHVIGKDASGSLTAPDGSSYGRSVVGSGPRELDVKPRSLSVVRSGSTAILTWTPGSDAASHIVGAIIGSDTASLKRAVLGGTADSHVFNDLRAGTYTYIVIGLDEYGAYRSPGGTWYYDFTTGGQQ